MKVFEEDYIIILLVFLLFEGGESVRVIELGLFFMACFKGFYVVYLVSKGLFFVKEDLELIVDKLFYFFFEGEGGNFFFFNFGF